jgi:ligand-binding sensor domain-containing protein
VAARAASDETDRGGRILSWLKRGWEWVAVAVVVVLLVTGEIAVYRAKHTLWSEYTKADGLADNHVTSMAVAPDGSLWLGTPHGASRLDGDTWTTYTKSDGLASDAVVSIVVAADGALWFRSWYSGVTRFDGKTWTVYGEVDGLTDGYVRDVAVSPDGSVWVGAASGVARFDGETWISYTTPGGLGSHRPVLSIAVAPNGTVWCAVGGDGGVLRFDGQTWTAYSTAEGLVSNRVDSVVAAPDGTVWFGTTEGVSRFDGDTWTTYTVYDGLAGNVVSSIDIAPDGAAWFRTEGGISRFHDETWTTYRPGTCDLPAFRGPVSAIGFDRDGQVWIGSPELGIGILDQGTRQGVCIPATVRDAWGIARPVGLFAAVSLAFAWLGRRVANRGLLGRAAAPFMCLFGALALLAALGFGCAASADQAWLPAAAGIGATGLGLAGCGVIATRRRVIADNTPSRSIASQADSVDLSEVDAPALATMLRVARDPAQRQRVLDELERRGAIDEI